MSGFTELARIVTFRPLSTPLPPANYNGTFRSPFSASWTSTVELLAREIKHLRPREAVLEIDLARGDADLRADGMPRAQARQNTPGVVLSLLGSTHGDLRYPCHRFHHWEDNVRALALSLEALRKVDRYGVTKRGEQYAGWRALTAGGPSAERGRELIRQHGSVRQALMATHPDHDGNAEDFADVQAAREADGG